MKRLLATLLTTLILAGSAAMPITAAPFERERHPMITKAISALERARGDLQDAAHDFCGHRAEALEATNNAIAQLRLALESDRASTEPRLNDDASSVVFQKAAYTEPWAAERNERRERHPEIREAIRALEHAKGDLQHADHDFHGHREAALDSVNRALNQLQAALACDKR